MFSATSDGQYVTEGDLLLPLDDAQPRAALALAQAELKSAEASLRQSQQLLTRYERLINNHSISRNDVDTARMQRDVAAAAAQQAKARVEAQQIVLSYTQIAAPVTGRGPAPFTSGRWSIRPAACWWTLCSWIRCGSRSPSTKPRFSAKPASTPISTL